MKQKSNGNPPEPQIRGRIRAIRHDDVESQLERSRIKLGLSGEFAVLDQMQPHRLVRALRMARRAACGGARDYDPVRHLVLVRYLKSLRLPGASATAEAAGDAKELRLDRRVLALR